MIGVILMTQLITYPSFLKIDKNEFVSFHNNYVKNISINENIPKKAAMALEIAIRRMNKNDIFELHN